MMERDEPLTTGDVARHCHVTPAGVWKWLKSGKLKGYRTPGGHYRVARPEFEDFLLRYGFPAASEFLPRRNASILVAEHDRGTAGQIREILTGVNRGYRIHCAEDSFEAGRQVATLRPDLAVFDMEMPGLSGFGMCRRLKSDESTKHMKVLAITEWGSESDARALECGADASLRKPLSPDLLVTEVSRLLAGVGEFSLALETP